MVDAEYGNTFAVARRFPAAMPLGIGQPVVFAFFSGVPLDQEVHGRSVGECLIVFEDQVNIFNRVIAAIEPGSAGADR